MGQSIVQVDAFTDTAFRGNPAAVCVLSQARSDAWMQSVAQEMNLSETAFLLPQEGGYHLRWFTPTTEVPLCGHATLASAHVLWTEGHLSPDAIARFQTQSGELTARFMGGWIELNFPVNRSVAIDLAAEVATALGEVPVSSWKNSLGYLVELSSAEAVRTLRPDLDTLQSLGITALIVTSVGDSASGYDIVSRFFAPGLGIDEDPVTGAAHCCLAPFWRDRLKKDSLLAYQASARGGVMKVGYDGGDRVTLAGQAVTVLRGELT